MFHFSFFTLQVCFLLFSKFPSCFSITLYLLALCCSIHLVVSILILSIATLSIVIKLRYCPLSSNCSFVAGHWLSVLFLRFCFGKRVQMEIMFTLKVFIFLTSKVPSKIYNFFTTSLLAIQLPANAYIFLYGWRNIQLAIIYLHLNLYSFII